MRDFNFQDKNIWAVFTPITRVKRLIEKYGLFDLWVSGATILDPTAWCGFFIEWFISLAVEKNVNITEKMIHSLFWVELEKEFVDAFFKNMLTTYNISFPKEHFVCENFLYYSDQNKFDIIVWNPPRQNFVDLPQWCKDDYKAFFAKYSLIKNMQDMLLGSSRIDISALIVSKSIKDHLKPNGKACFFLPLSLFLNDWAHQWFRSWMIWNTYFCYDEIWDFNGEDIFWWIATRYWVVAFSRDKCQGFPLKYNQLIVWKRETLSAKPLHSKDGPLTIIHKDNISLLDMKKIILTEWSKPRQWVNTCWANHVFMFDSYEPVDANYVKLGNKKNPNVILPKTYIEPLMDKKNFTWLKTPQKWVLILHNKQTWKPLEWWEFSSDKTLVNYLNSWYDFLNARKWILINTQISKWYRRWLLWVWPYSFKPYKLAWQAYGEKTFNPQIVYCQDWLNWQGNQSLQAFIWFDTEQDAKNALIQLQHPDIEKYLLSMQMEWTCNRAQPGKISKLIEYRPSLIKWKSVPSLFST